MPDIDMDFCYIRRQEIIDYVKQKYGDDHVAQIVTFGTMAARQAVRDVGCVLNVSYAETDAIAKLVPTELHMTIDRALETSRSSGNAMKTTRPQSASLIRRAALRGCRAMRPRTRRASSSPTDRSMSTSRSPEATIRS